MAQFAFVQAWEIGLLQAPFVPESFLCWIFWSGFCLSGLTQYLVLAKAQRRWMYWLLPGTLALGMLAGEIGCWTITGIDLLLPLLGWWLSLTFLLGTAGVVLIFTLVRKAS